MLTLLFFAFLSGMVTIAAPCIWPILPIVLSSAATGGRRRPLGIVTGLVMSFMVATLALSWLVRAFGFSPDGLRIFSVIVIVLLGVSLLVPAVGARLEAAVSRLLGRFGSSATKGTGFGSGFLTGAALGVVWAPCAGPILAAVATLAATRAVSIEAILVTFSFGIGIAIPLFLFAMFGQKLFSANRFLRAYTGRIQQVFGVVMIFAAVAIGSGYDKILQSKILDLFPNYGTFLNQFEDRPEVEEALDELKKTDMEDGVSRETKAASGLPILGTAPEFRGISTWLNTDGGPLSMADLRGKVVLVDFWTYSCINCIRTLPYVTGWYEKYKDDGFVVVGVHTPEFVFEHKTQNVVDAMKRYGIGYPVAQDNDYGTWKAYKNRYWPAHYLIDQEGRVRYTHFGEGEYDATEKNIQALLAEAGMSGANQELGIKNQTEEEGPFAKNRTPETYLGLARMDRFASPETAAPIAREYTIPEDIPLHSFASGGKWNLDTERAVAGESSASIVLHFRGDKVFLVLAPPSGSTGTVRVFLDGQAASADVSGSDVKEGVVTVDSDRLYELIDLQGTNGEHMLRLEFDTLGISAYAFTFG